MPSGSPAGVRYLPVTAELDRGAIGRFDGVASFDRQVFCGQGDGTVLAAPAGVTR